MNRSFVYLARVHRDERARIIELRVIPDEDHFEIVDGDEFITIATTVNLFPEPAAAQP